MDYGSVGIQFSIGFRRVVSVARLAWRAVEQFRLSELYRRFQLLTQKLILPEPGAETRGCRRHWPGRGLKASFPVR